MPNPQVITPKALAIILLASAGKEVASFMVPLPEQLIIEVKSRIINFGIQYGSMAIGEAVVGSKLLDMNAPAKYFVQGVESLANASTHEEAVARGTVAAAVLILSSLSSENPNASLTFGGFLLVLAQNVLFPGSQVIFSKNLLQFYILKNILIWVITEIGVERKRKQLKLPRAKFKVKLFRKCEKKKFVFKYVRLRKRKIKVFSHHIPVFVPYQKELMIKQPAMVKPITI